MKRALPSLFVCIAFLMAARPQARGQDDQPIRIPEGTVLHAVHAKPQTAARSATAPSSGSPLSAESSRSKSSTAASLPLWSYSILSPVDGNTYAGQMVGESPFDNPSSMTIVPTVLIPVRLTFLYRNGAEFVFDPTAPNPSCIGAGSTGLSLTQQSPLFNNFDYDLNGSDVGDTQYIDAFQRADFWQNVSSSSYHVLLAPVTIPLQRITVRSSSVGAPIGTVYVASGECGNGLLGVMNINWWDNIAQALLVRLNVSPSQFAVFIFYNAAMSLGNPTNLNNCCVLGYHNAVGSPMRTYAVADFEGRTVPLFTGVLDVADMAHEIGEWMDDPTGANPTPAWGPVGQVTGCQNNLEVGDPLTGIDFPTITMPNGFSYHVQELAFFSWFFRQNPSLGVNGWYSNNGTFLTDAGPLCSASAQGGGSVGHRQSRP